MLFAEIETGGLVAIAAVGAALGALAMKIADALNSRDSNRSKLATDNLNASMVRDREEMDYILEKKNELIERLDTQQKGFDTEYRALLLKHQDCEIRAARNDERATRSEERSTRLEGRIAHLEKLAIANYKKLHNQEPPSE